ncbi:MAG: hypothetical protein IT384_09615 [Deltaproteobacteria bacterium]|nr:hypothetical protein [Deltaproteobacteria bacterium]
MTSPSVPQLIRRQKVELALARTLDRGLVLVAVTFLFWVAYVMYVQVWEDTFYLLLQLMSITSGLSRFAVLEYFRLPLLARELANGDPDERAAACAALEQLRERVVPKVLAAAKVPAEPERIRSITCAEILDLTVRTDRPRVRAALRVYAAAYLLLLSSITVAAIRHVPSLY